MLLVNCYVVDIYIYIYMFMCICVCVYICIYVYMYILCNYGVVIPAHPAQTAFRIPLRFLECAANRIHMKARVAFRAFKL